MIKKLLQSLNKEDMVLGLFLLEKPKSHYDKTIFTYKYTCYIFDNDIIERVELREVGDNYLVIIKFKGTPCPNDLLDDDYQSVWASLTKEQYDSLKESWE